MTMSFTAVVPACQERMLETAPDVSAPGFSLTSDQMARHDSGKGIHLEVNRDPERAYGSGRISGAALVNWDELIRTGWPLASLSGRARAAWRRISWMRKTLPGRPHLVSPAVTAPRASGGGPRGAGEMTRPRPSSGPPLLGLPGGDGIICRVSGGSARPGGGSRRVRGAPPPGDAIVWPGTARVRPGRPFVACGAGWIAQDAPSGDRPRSAPWVAYPAGDGDW